MLHEIRYSIPLSELGVTTAKDFAIMHCAEHVKFEGFGGLSRLDMVYQQAEQLGGEISANTSRTGLHFKLTFLEEFYTEAKSFLDAMVNNPTPNLANFEIVEKELIDQLNEDGYAMCLTDKMYKRNFKNVYSFPDGGTKKLLKEVTKDDISKFFKKIEHAKKYFISSLEPEKSINQLKNVKIEKPVLKKTWENYLLHKSTMVTLESNIFPVFITEEEKFIIEKAFQDQFNERIWVGRSILPGFSILSIYIDEDIDLKE
jgi:predicted Zn-dependent peptidase